MFQGSFKGVLRNIEGCSENQGSFKVSKRRSKGVSRQFQICSKEYSRVLKEVSSVFHEYFIKSFKGVSLKFCFAILM